MAAQWYCLIGQQQYGPFTSEQIQQLAQQGQLQREHYVRTETDSRWTAASDLPGLFPTPQAKANPPTAPTVTQPKKKKKIAPPASASAASASPAPAGGAVPQAQPVTSPATAVPAAVPIAATPSAAASGDVPRAARPAQARPAVAVPVPAAPAAAVPVAAAPVAAAPAAAGSASAVPVAGAAGSAPVAPAAALPPGAARAGGRPSSAVRPIPVAPTVTAAVPPAPARDETGVGYKRRGSRKKSQQLVGGLTAALLVLIVIAVIVMNRSPAKKPTGESDQAVASARGNEAEPSSDPEVDPEVDPAAIVRPSSEPAAIADPPQAASGAAPEAADKPKPNPLPAVDKWLDATRTKGGLRGLLAVGIGKAWLDKPAGGPAILNVEVQVSNRSHDETLEFTGWRPDNQPQSAAQAMMVDQGGKVLRAAPLRSPTGRRAARRHIDPEESATEQLRFVFPEEASPYFRLALPYAALGQTGCLGFELPRQMIKEGDPDAKEKVRPAAAEPGAETVLPAGATVKPEPGAPETIGDLRSEIESRKDAPTDAAKTPPQPSADEPSLPAEAPRKEPEKIPDIRKLIEESETPKVAPKDEGQPGGNMQEEPQTS
ncbi:MAG: DUF4339 domain-containing protein [Candidatus Anammoximicrobium sp.]|nr:DUF4339 domain-containing protein [Candidatus Anammoximicrobium sp.]